MVMLLIYIKFRELIGSPVKKDLLADFINYFATNEEKIVISVLKEGEALRQKELNKKK